MVYIQYSQDNTAGKYVIQLYIRVSVVLSWACCRREMEEMIYNLDSAVKFQQLLQLRV